LGVRIAAGAVVQAKKKNGFLCMRRSIVLLFGFIARPV